MMDSPALQWRECLSMEANLIRTTRVIANERISDDAWVLRLDRRDLVFRPGELISLHGQSELDHRDYTIASGTEDEEIEVLYRLVPHGALTPQLVKWNAGDEICFKGPYGTFVLRDATVPTVFVATGTGIAPARSFLRSNPGMEMTVLHGVRERGDLFYRAEFEAAPEVTSYVPCVSSETGRVTDWLRSNPLPPGVHVYLCGANEMIYEASDILAGHELFTEPYYYRELGS